MHRLCVRPSTLKGTLLIPPSKSQTIRAIFFGMMGKGRTLIRNPLLSTDTEAAVSAARLVGARVDLREGCLEIEGVAGTPLPARDVIDAKNSGLVLRFMSALAGLIPTYTVITGDESIRTRRPIMPLIEGLRRLGAFAETTRLDGFAPVVIRGLMQPGSISVQGEDSQPVSALLTAASFLKGQTEIHVQNPGEHPWIDLTLSWLDRLNIGYTRKGYTHFSLSGSAAYDGFEYLVPADFSSAAFPIGAALITGSELVIENLDFSDAQGDKKLIYALQKMGANIEIEERRLIVKKSRLTGSTLDVGEFIDGIAILAVIACFAEGVTEIHGAANARRKESDRLSAITCELKKMGAKIEEREESLIVTPAPLRGSSLFSHHDHRIALSLAVAALGAASESAIDGFDCTTKTYPTFCQDMRAIGAKL
ncbi:MAG: 3-phosphoshikimate 1-carboxyvinyltransferase [Chlamydiales bacterium]|nr:3-phosphoshikimate 1-carboxyvinyltransferase [Chlamydiales bacterium]